MLRHSCSFAVPVVGDAGAWLTLDRFSDRSPGAAAARACE